LCADDNTVLPTALWKLPAWLQLFAGKTLRFSFSAPNWEDGAARMHDFLFAFTRGEGSPWAAIVPKGFSVRVPCDIEPLLDLPGPLLDGSARDLNLTATLATREVHAYLLIVGSEMHSAVLSRMRTFVNLAMGAGAVEQPRIIVVRVADKDFGATPRKLSLLENACTEGMKQLQNKFFAAFTSDAVRTHGRSCVSFHTITPMREAGLGLHKLHDVITKSFHFRTGTRLRRVAAELLAKSTDAINVLSGLSEQSRRRSLANADPAAAADAAADAAAVAAEKQRLLLHCQRTSNGTKLSDIAAEVHVDGSRSAAQSKFAATITEQQQDMVIDKYLASLRESLDAAVNGADDEGSFKEYLDEAGMSEDKITEHGLDAFAFQTRQLRTTSIESKILQAMLRPAKQGIDDFFGVTVQRKLWEEMIPDAEELTNLILQELLSASMRELVTVKTFDPQDVDMRAKLDSWLLVAELRAAISSVLQATLYKTLGALSHADLQRGVMRVALAKEHFPEVVTWLDAKYTALPPPTFAQRNTDLGTRMKSLNLDVCEALLHFARFWLVSVLHLAADDATKVVSRMLSGGVRAEQPAAAAGGVDAAVALEDSDMGDSAAEIGAYQALRGMLNLNAPPDASAATDHVEGVPDGQAPISEQIREVLRSLAALLQQWNITPLAGLLSDQVMEAEEVQSTARARSGVGTTALAREYKEGLQKMDLAALKQVAKHLGVCTKLPRLHTSDAYLKMLHIDALVENWRRINSSNNNTRGASGSGNKRPRPTADC
jgi:hypothetical protein